MSTVTKDWKYTSSFHAGDGMEPSEDLFHLSEDPFELTKRARHPEHQSTIEGLRKTYDEQLAVESHQGQARLFNRHANWEAKAVKLTVKGSQKKK